MFGAITKRFSLRNLKISEKNDSGHSSHQPISQESPSRFVMYIEYGNKTKNINIPRNK